MSTVRKVGGIILIVIGIWIILMTIIMNWGDLLQMCGDRAINWVINLLIGIFSIEIGILGLKGWNMGGLVAILIGTGEILAVIINYSLLTGFYLHFYGLPGIGIESLFFGLKWEMVIIIVGGILILVSESDKA